MLYKILAITRKELYQTFTDRNLLILMLAAPLAISTIVGVVFGGMASDGGLSFSDIPVALVNLDTGAEQQGQPVNYGDQLVGLFVPTDAGGFGSGDCPLIAIEDSASGFNQPLDELVTATQLDDVAVGRAGVENGDYAVLVVIPADFSAKISPNVNVTGAATSNSPATAVEVYANSGQSIEGIIVRSIVEGFTNQLLTGNIAIGASINALFQTDPLTALQLSADQANPEVATVLGCGFAPGMATISLDPQSLAADDAGDDRSVIDQILVQTGSAQGVFFALFAGQFGVLSIISERRAGTLQRMLISPTPRSVILIGKVFSTFVMVLVQLTLLLAALTVIASLIAGEPSLIWGTNLLAIGAVVLALALCVAGFGVLLTGLARTPEQVGPIGAVINIAMVAVGGGFGFAPVFPVAYLSLVFWGMDAFTKLAAGNSDILLNLVVLVVEGVLLFGIGLFLFNRRIEVL